MSDFLIHEATLVNEGKTVVGDVLIRNGKIVSVTPPSSIRLPLEEGMKLRHIQAKGNYLLPGVIDDQVHFRDPGLTHKGDLYTESKAAVAGGVTSFMDMPNTDPKTITIGLLEEKFRLAESKSLANFSFFLGGTNNNLDEIRQVDPTRVCGVKLFLGASTGNMLVDDPTTLDEIFRYSPVLVAIHSEDEPTIRENLKRYQERYGEQIPVEAHPLIRSEEACYRSSERAIALARKHHTRLHLLHVSTVRETDLLDRDKPLKEKRVTGEVCVHHLWFDDRDYARLGSRIKWNPAIKTERDKLGLFDALLNDRLDIIATDHAPHLLQEKANPYLSSPSGGPLIQHSLVMMLEFYHQKKISLEQIVRKMAHGPADLYRIEKRGYIREGYHADLVLVDLNCSWIVNQGNILYKCGWSPLEGTRFSSAVLQTWVNGNLVFDHGKFDETTNGQRLSFNGN